MSISFKCTNSRNGRQNTSGFEQTMQWDYSWYCGVRRNPWDNIWQEEFPLAAINGIKAFLCLEFNKSPWFSKRWNSSWKLMHCAPWFSSARYIVILCNYFFKRHDMDQILHCKVIVVYVRQKNLILTDLLNGKEKKKYFASLAKMTTFYCYSQTKYQFTN